MVSHNKELLRKILEHSKIKTMLEIGSGRCSTRMAREILAGEDHYCLSLEESDIWHKKMNQLCPANQHGKVLKVNVEWKNKHLFLDYDSKKKFDFILIDGPTVHSDTHKKVTNKLSRYLSNDKFWIKTYPFSSGGVSSLHMLEYVLRFFRKETFVLVDYRLAAVYYYLQTFVDKNELDFWGVIDDGFVKRRRIHKNILKEKYWDSIIDDRQIIRNRPTLATFICKKNNTIIHDIFKDIGVNVVSLL